jgi:hypothetical protein
MIHGCSTGHPPRKEQSVEAPTAGTPSAPKMLTAEERGDLRRRVLAGIPLTVDEARSVIASIRQGQGVAALAGEAKAAKGGGGRKKKSAISDEQLDKELADLGL